MKALLLQRNFSEGKRPKRANSLTNVNSRTFYLFLLKQGNWVEIHSIICTCVVAKKAVSCALKSTRTSEIQRDDFVENSPGKRFDYFFFKVN